MGLELLKIEDIDIVEKMIEEGRKHIQTFKIKQWVNGYPNRDTIKEDIKNKAAYVYKEDEKILAYFALFDYEKTYDYINGSWLLDEPYVVIHRMVVSDFEKGLGSKTFNELKKNYNHIRIDTHEGNISMNKCLLKNDFKKCGIIYLENGDERIAYEWFKSLERS